MKVYVVTAGEYSDYHIIGVRLTKEEAQKLCDMFNNPYHTAPTVEEYDTDAFAKLFAGMKQYYAYFNDSCELIRLEYDPEPEEYFNETVIEPISNTIKYTVELYAIDEEHAKKTAKDRLMQYLAEKEGL